MTTPHDDQRSARDWITPRTIAGAVLLVLVIAFALANTDDVTVDYVFGDTDAPMIVVILVVLAVGAFVGYVAGRRATRR